MPKYLDEQGFTHFYDNIASKPVRSFETVVAMQAATDLKAGMTCHTNGFHAIGDGGAAYYTVSANGTANGMDVLALENGMFAKLVVMESYVTPEMFGAYGDGATNDTACINRALEVSDTVKGASTYLIDQIIIASGKLVSGGEYLLNADVGFVLTMQSTLQDTLIQKADYPKLTDTSVGVKVIGGYNTLHNVNVNKCRYGYVFYNEQNGGCVYNSIENGLLYDCVEPVYMKSDAASWCNENSFMNTSCRISGSYRSYINRQEDAADYQAKYAVTLTHETDTHNLNMNRFYNVSTEGCFNGFYVEGGKNLFVSCRTEQNTKSYNFNKVTSSDRHNVIVLPYDTDPMEKIQYTTSEDFAMYTMPASTVIPTSGILMFDTSQHTTIDNATEKIYRTVASADGYTGIGVASNGTLNMIFSANYNYGMKSFYNFCTYSKTLANLKALTDVSSGATFYAGDLHKHVTYYGGKWWDESGAEV